MNTNLHATEEVEKPSYVLRELCTAWADNKSIEGDTITSLEKWLDDHYKYVTEGNEAEEKRHTELLEKIKTNNKHDEVLKILEKRTPVFILFNNYFKVKPTIHLDHLAQRIEKNILDRKSTRLNSSHEAISYAVFCLKQ